MIRNQVTAVKLMYVCWYFDLYRKNSVWEQSRQRRIWRISCSQQKKYIPTLNIGNSFIIVWAAKSIDWLILWKYWWIFMTLHNYGVQRLMSFGLQVLSKVSTAYTRTVTHGCGWVHIQCESKKPLRFSDIFSQTVGSFSSKFYMPIIRSYLR